MTKRVVLTGATGLIGKEAIKPLEELGFEVVPLTSKVCNLFEPDAVDKFFDKVKPEYLLHFAWFTGVGYLESDLNPKYVEASLNMLNAFKKNGGKRVVFAGTCFEYKFTEELLREDRELNPTTLYAQSKCELREKAEKFANDNDISFGWGRIFYVYGHGEPEKRLTGALVNKLSREEEVIINCGQLVKDYMYTKDIAGAFSKFLDTNVCGCVNICTGFGVSLEEFSKEFAKKLDKKRFLKVKYDETNQPLKIVGDNTRLIKEVGYNVKYTLSKAVGEIVENV